MTTTPIRAAPALRVLCAVFAATAAVSARAASQEAALVARVVGGQARIVKVDPATGAERTLYGVDPPARWLSDVRVAPSGKYIAVLETSRGHVSNYVYDRLPLNRLVVLDTSGRIVQIVERDVRRFTWRCDSDKLALITGPYREGGFEFRPDSVLLHDVAANSDVPVAFPIRPTEVVWAAFDSSVYVGRPSGDDSLEVWRLHLSTGNISRTPYRGLLFSPSGAFYLTRSSGLRSRPGWHVVERVTGRESALPDTSVGVVRGWAFSTGDQLLLIRRQTELLGRAVGGPRASLGRSRVRGYAVYDVASRRVSGRGDGDPSESIAASPGVVPIVRGGRVEILRGPIP